VQVAWSCLGSIPCIGRVVTATFRGETGGGARAAEDGLVELADAIVAVRQQLIAAQARSLRIVAGQELIFTVGAVAVAKAGLLGA
jgi:hypothetical protein